MNNERFLLETHKTFIRSLEILEKKGKEYSTPDDRLGHFYDVAEINQRNPAEALMGMAAKHYSSVRLMARDPNRHTLAEWREKLDDLRNYTFLLDALLIELVDSDDE